jgi:sulfonate transport system permease protein
VTVIAVLIYVVTAAVGRALTPWFRSTSISVSAAADSELRRGQVSGTAGTATGLVRSAASLIVSLAVIVGLWYGAIAASGLNRYIAKTPADVWTYLFAGDAAATRRGELLGQLAVTLRDAGIGYVSGSVAAVVVALAVVLSRAVQQTVLPMAIALRSVPLVAMTPLLALVFGRGIAGVTVIVGIVTFFPTLVNVVEGLRSAPAQSLDLIRAFGGGSGTTLRRVQLPYALPALFASAKIAAPGALLGAMLAEWLATGHGLGYLMLLNSTTSKFASLWSATVLITVVSVLIYNVVGAVEKPVLRRFSLGQGASSPR